MTMYYVLQGEAGIVAVLHAESFFEVVAGHCCFVPVTGDDGEERTMRPLAAGDMLIDPVGKAMARLVTGGLDDDTLLPILAYSWE